MDAWAWSLCWMSKTFPGKVWVLLFLKPGGQQEKAAHSLHFGDSVPYRLLVHHGAWLSPLISPHFLRWHPSNPQRGFKDQRWKVVETYLIPSWLQEVRIPRVRMAVGDWPRVQSTRKCGGVFQKCPPKLLKIKRVLLAQPWPQHGHGTSWAKLPSPS